MAVFVCGTDNNIFFFMVLAINQWDSEVKRRKEFCKIFGFQEVIDKVLGIEAQFLHQYFLSEQEWLSDPETRATNAENYEEMLEGSKIRVNINKKEFWRKVDLARQEGYRVPES